MSNSTSDKQHLDSGNLKLVEAVLDFIRSNLSNIRNTWGPSSQQYKDASEIMQKYFDENMKKLQVDTTEIHLEDLLSNLSLEENSS